MSGSFCLSPTSITKDVVQQCCCLLLFSFECYHDGSMKWSYISTMPVCMHSWPYPSTVDIGAFQQKKPSKSGHVAELHFWPNQFTNSCVLPATILKQNGSERNTNLCDPFCTKPCIQKPYQLQRVVFCGAGDHLKPGRYSELVARLHIKGSMACKEESRIYCAYIACCLKDCSGVHHSTGCSPPVD